MTEHFSATPVLDQLCDFQRNTVEHAFDRLYCAPDSTRRFLVADETGLGKTMVAKGLIAKTIERLQDDPSVERIDIVYVCSNADIAQQNLSKLTIGDHQAAPATRLTMLVAQPELLRTAAPSGIKPVTFVSFTPGTSFAFGFQTGQARERAVLALLLSENLELGRSDSRALRLLMRGGVSDLDRFGRIIDEVQWDVERRGGWEPHIKQAFFDTLATPGRVDAVRSLIDELRGRRQVPDPLKRAVAELTAEMRRELARSAVRALAPDLIILDEFQRFTHLMNASDETAELATHLFEQPDARVVLLSATPYKPFTFAEERESGEDHYENFLDTLRFLGRGDEVVDPIKHDLRRFRQDLLSDSDATGARDSLQQQLLRLMSRTERPVLGGEVMLAETVTNVDDVRGAEIAGYVALHELAEAVDAPISVEYWKSAPYFANFLDNYKLGERVKASLDEVGEEASVVRRILRRSQHLDASAIEMYEPIDWGNARLRRLAADTIENDWWKLLWLPPSLPYHDASGPYADPGAQGLTKRLVFSSWVAAPTAIASLLSYEADRRINAVLGRSDNTRAAREAVRPRLRYRVEDGEAMTMSTLSLVFPNPALAELTDPLEFARSSTDRSIDALMRWSGSRVLSMTGPDGDTTSTESSAWFWAAPLLGDAPWMHALRGEDVGSLAAALQGVGDEDEPSDSDGGRVEGSLDVHLRRALATMNGPEPSAARPADLVASTALLGVGGFGNVAWRALGRLCDEGDATTLVGRWKAAATLAGGLRSLFNRPDAMLIIDGLGTSSDDTYWRNVLAYCRDGNLQAVLDEYVHHLAGSEGQTGHTDESLMKIAVAARGALSIRQATLRAMDVKRKSATIALPVRFALRFGGTKQREDDVRLTDTREAFNSPFWPFVLASTSIGQEGVDLHWWCHSIVHWNLPSNPVDFEQREGRVNRYKGHAIRRNVADAFGQAALGSGVRDIWAEMFRLASQERDETLGDLKPYWVYPGHARIERHVYSFPLSRDRDDWARLQQLLALYRLAYGQPRQDDMLELLNRQGLSADPTAIASLVLDLRPPTGARSPHSSECDSIPLETEAQ